MFEVMLVSPPLDAQLGLGFKVRAEINCLISECDLEWTFSG